MRSKLSYGNVMSTVAVFIALGGTSYAAVSITSKDVRNNSLTGRDIRNSSITSGDIRDRSLRAKDFAGGQLPAGSRGAAGAIGPQGPAGATGPQGPAGTPAPRSGTVVVSHLEFEKSSTSTTYRDTACSRAGGTMLAPIQLPTGSRVTKIDVYVTDTMAGPGDDVQAFLRRNRLTTHTSEVVASGATSGAPGNAVITLTPPSGTTWTSTDSPELNYQSESDTSHAICGAVVHFDAL